MHDLQTSYELHQFRCPKCFVWWWKPVPIHKPVSKCYHCRICLNSLKPLEQFGVGRFVCPCGNIFFRKCQASDSRKCDNCGCRVCRPYIRPYFRTDDARHIPVTPEQQYQFNPYVHVNATASHGCYHYPPSYFPHPGPTVNATFYDMPQPRRFTQCNTFGDFILPQLFEHISQRFAARNPPRSANPATMHPPRATRDFPPMYSSGSVSLQSSNTTVRPALCVATDHTASLAIQPPAAISHPSPHSPHVDPRTPQSPISASSAPAYSLDCTNTSGQTTMAISLRGVPPVLDYVPLKDQVIPSSSLNPQSVSECNHSPQPLTATPSTSASLSLAPGSANVPGEATAIPSSPISLPSATGTSLQCNQQPPSTTPSTSGPLPIFPSAISSDPDPLRPNNSLHTQPQLNGSSASENFRTPLADALTDLHIPDTPCAQALPETGSTPIQSQGLLHSDGAPMAALISPQQSASSGSTSIDPPLPSTATTQTTPLPDASIGVLVKASHVSSEKPPPDHSSVTVDYNPSVTTAIPPPCDPMTLSESQRDLTAPNHRDSSQAGSDADSVSLAAATNSDLSLPETSAPTIATAESSNTVAVSTAQMDANTQTEVSMSTLASTLNPSQVLPVGAALPSSSSLPPLPQQATTVSTPQATATRFESKAVQTATPPTFNVVNNNFIVSVGGNPAAAAAAGPLPNPPHQVAQNDQWTSYYDNRVRIRKNPQDLKYKQVSTIHDCSGSTEYSADDSVPRLNDPYWKHHRVYHHANRNQHNMHTYNHYDLDYDMFDISSDEED